MLWYSLILSDTNSYNVSYRKPPHTSGFFRILPDTSGNSVSNVFLADKFLLLPLPCLKRRIGKLFVCKCEKLWSRISWSPLMFLVFNSVLLILLQVKCRWSKSVWGERGIPGIQRDSSVDPVVLGRLSLSVCLWSQMEHKIQSSKKLLSRRIGSNIFLFCSSMSYNILPFFFITEGYA